MVASSPLCQLNGGCMGCCGFDFPSKEQVAEAIKKNTLEFNFVNPISDIEFLSFRERRPAMDLRSGVCRNLIKENGCFLCPLHPSRHDGKDLRLGHCDTEYLCNTAKNFAQFDEAKQNAFVAFIEQKKLDNITYSILMDKGILMREFNRQNAKKASASPIPRKNESIEDVAPKH